jgi:hypothetical protein
VVSVGLAGLLSASHSSWFKISAWIEAGDSVLHSRAFSLCSEEEVARRCCEPGACPSIVAKSRAPLELSNYSHSSNIRRIRSNRTIFI